MLINIWNPSIPLSQSVEQEEPLDLSVKSKETQVSLKSLEETFDFAKFYYNYYAISARSLPAYPIYELCNPLLSGEHKENRKRKYSSSTCESDESGSGDEKKSRIETETITRIDNLEKKTHKKSKTSISSIKDSCDCRFCYEDHIIKMRLKTERPWLDLMR